LRNLGNDFSRSLNAGKDIENDSLKKQNTDLKHQNEELNRLLLGSHLTSARKEHDGISMNSDQIVKDQNAQVQIDRLKHDIKEQNQQFHTLTEGTSDQKLKNAYMMIQSLRDQMGYLKNENIKYADKCS
jgi:hypothetical protein